MKRSTLSGNIAQVTVMVLLLLVTLPACGPGRSYPPPPMTDTEIVLAVSDLPRDEPVFFTYRTQGKNVNFFVIRFGDRVLSFLDACVNCYPRRKGYAFRDAMVTCRACDTSYSIYKLEQGLGGCFPIRFDGRLEKGRYTIMRSVLDRHAGKF